MQWCMIQLDWWAMKWARAPSSSHQQRILLQNKPQWPCTGSMAGLPATQFFHLDCHGDSFTCETTLNKSNVQHPVADRANVSASNDGNFTSANRQWEASTHGQERQEVLAVFNLICFDVISWCDLPRDVRSDSLIALMQSLLWHDAHLLALGPSCTGTKLDVIHNWLDHSFLWSCLLRHDFLSPSHPWIHSADAPQRWFPNHLF